MNHIETFGSIATKITLFSGVSTHPGGLGRRRTKKRKEMCLPRISIPTARDMSGHLVHNTDVLYHNENEFCRPAILQVISWCPNLTSPIPSAEHCSLRFEAHQ